MNQTPRWGSIIPLTVLCSFFLLAIEISGVGTNIPARPMALFVIAAITAFNIPPASGPLVFAWCGLLQDLFLGSRLGTNMASFVIAGWVLSEGRMLARDISWLGKLSLTVGGAAFASWFCLGLSIKPAALFTPGAVFLTIGHAIATLIAYPFAYFFLHMPSLRTWREGEFRYL